MFILNYYKSTVIGKCNWVEELNRSRYYISGDGVCGEVYVCGVNNRSMRVGEVVKGQRDLSEW